MMSGLTAGFIVLSVFCSHPSLPWREMVTDACPVCRHFTFKILDAGSYLWGVLKSQVSNAGSAPVQSFLLYGVLVGTLLLCTFYKVFLVEGGGMEETQFSFWGAEESPSFLMVS